MKCLKLKQPTLFDLFLLTYPILSFIAETVIRNQLPPIKQNPYLKFLFTCSSHLIIGLVYALYQSFSLKSTQKEKKQSIISINKSTIFTRVKGDTPQHRKRFYSFIIIISMALINVAAFLGFRYMILTIEYKNNLFLELFAISFNILFQKIILNRSIFIHHSLSFALMSLGLIGLLYRRLSFDSSALIILYYIVYSLILSLILSLSKRIMEKKYIHPLIFSLGYGLSGFVMLVIICCVCKWFDLKISYQIIPNIDNIAESFKALFETWRNVSLTILFTIVYCLFYTSYWVIHYKRGPLSELLLLKLVHVFDWFYYEKMKNSLYFILSFVGSLLYIAGEVMYLEFVALSFFG